MRPLSPLVCHFGDSAKDSRGCRGIEPTTGFGPEPSETGAAGQAVVIGDPEPPGVHADPAQPFEVA